MNFDDTSIQNQNSTIQTKVNLSSVQRSTDTALVTLVTVDAGRAAVCSQGSLVEIDEISQDTPVNNGYLGSLEIPHGAELLEPLDSAGANEVTPEVEQSTPTPTNSGYLLDTNETENNNRGSDYQKLVEDNPYPNASPLLAAN